VTTSSHKTAGVLEQQVSGMVERIGRDRDARVSAIEHAGRSERRGLLNEARREARVRVRDVVREDRARLERRLQREEASLATVVRENQLKRHRERLRQGHSLVVEALRERWADDATRREWLAGVLAVTDVLSPGQWLVEHPPGLNDAERDFLKAGVRDRSSEEPVLQAGEGQTTGLRVTSKGATLDMTAEGILEDSDRINGLLLASILALESASSEES